MNSQQVQDMRLMYEAVYNDELWELANEYNNTIYDEDIVEVATEYFYTYGLNEDGIDILIEKVGLDNFVEFVYDLSEDLILTEARKVSKAKKQPGSLRSRQQEKLAAQRAAAERTETEKKEPESKGADTEAKAEQPKKKPVRDAIARNIFRAVGAYNAGMERHSQATQTAGRLAGETGRTLGRIASLAGEAGRRGVEHVKKHGMKSLANEETEIGITGKKIPKPRTAKQQYELEKNRRKRKHLGKNVGGTQYSSDVNPYLNPRSVREEVEPDLFDAILEHLIAEGYADTNESALAIMANMSEEWREEILDEEVRGAKKGTIRSVIEKGGKSIKYVQSGGDILAGDRSSQERASAADRTTSGRNRANAARFQQDAKKSIETLNANPGEDPEDYGNTDDDHSGGKRHYKLGSTNRSSRARRASGR